MKKRWIVLFAMVLVCSLGVEALADDDAPADSAPALSPLSIYGNLTDETDASITVEDETGSGSVILNLLETTYYIDAETGAFITRGERTSDRVAVWYGPDTTRSIPPQSNAVAVVLNLPEARRAPYFAVAEAVERTDGQLRIVTGGGSLHVTVKEDTPILPYRTLNIVTMDDIQAGAKLMLWYDVVAMSYPAQTQAQQVVLLAPAAGDEQPLTEAETSDLIILTPDAGVASVNGAEVDLVGIFAEDDGTILLPLRQLCESMGYTVVWIPGTNRVELSREQTMVKLAFGSPVFTVGDTELALDFAPELRGGVTYVPTVFFETLLGARLTIITQGV